MEGDRYLLHMIPHGPGRAELHSTPHSTFTTTAHLTDQSGMLTSNFFPVGHTYIDVNFQFFYIYNLINSLQESFYPGSILRFLVRGYL